MRSARFCVHGCTSHLRDRTPRRATIAAPPHRQPTAEMRIATAAVGAFLGWAFQGVGPSRDARWALVRTEPKLVPVPGLGLLFGSDPTLALYCGAKVRRESYAPLAEAVAAKTGSGVLVLQSPQFLGLCVYAKKPANIAKVLEQYPTITCVAGHSIGGLWAAEFCRDLHERGAWPSAGLDFVHLGVHGKGVSLALSLSRRLYSARSAGRSPPRTSRCSAPPRKTTRSTHTSRASSRSSRRRHRRRTRRRQPRAIWRLRLAGLQKWPRVQGQRGDDAGRGAEGGGGRAARRGGGEVGTQTHT